MKQQRALRCNERQYPRQRRQARNALKPPHGRIKRFKSIFFFIKLTETDVTKNCQSYIGVLYIKDLHYMLLWIRTLVHCIWDTPSGAFAAVLCYSRIHPNPACAPNTRYHPLVLPSLTPTRRLHLWLHVWRIIFLLFSRTLACLCAFTNIPSATSDSTLSSRTRSSIDPRMCSMDCAAAVVLPLIQIKA